MLTAREQEALELGSIALALKLSRPVAPNLG